MDSSVNRTNVAAAPSARAGEPIAVGHESKAGIGTHVRNAALLALVLVALFWRVLFLGQTLIDVATLNNQLPWGYYSTERQDYPYNRRDLTDMYVTRDYFVVAAYREGEMPLWNPYTMAGHPIYADGVTRTLSPFLLFYTLFDVPLGYSLARVTELFLAAIFLYIFLVGIGASPRGALIAAMVFELSAHSMFHLTQLGWWGGLMWLPLILLFVDRAISRQSYFAAGLAGLFLAIQFYCGFLPTQIYYVAAIAIYYLFFALKPRDTNPASKNAWARLRQSLAMTAVTLGVGFALGATQWVPMLELLGQSNRRIIGSEWGYIYLPPWYAVTLLFPNFFGAAYDAKMVTLFTALNVSHDHILYLGAAALLPLGFSLYLLLRGGLPRYRRRRSGGLENLADIKAPLPGPSAWPLGVSARLYFFLALALLALLAMMAAPLYIPLTRFIPILQVIRVAVRAGVLFLFAAAVLIGFGVDALLKADSETLSRFARYARKLSYAVAGFVLTATLASYLVRLTGFAAETTERGRLAFARRAAEAISSRLAPPGLDILLPLLFFFMSAALVILLASGKVSRRFFFAGLVGLIAVDLCWHGTQYNESFDRSLVFPPTKITSMLQSLPAGRVLVTPSDLLSNRRVSSASTEKIIAPPNTLLAYQIPSVTGKNQLFPRGYREYASLIEPQPHLSHVVFDQARSPFFDLLNVRYVLTHTSRPALEGYDLLATDEGVSVYENRSAFPRAFFAGRVVEVRSRADALTVLSEPDFDPATTAVVDLDGKVTGAERSVREAAKGAAIIIEARRNRVLIETDNSGDGLLVLSDNHYPGWRATIDGEAAEVLRANYIMRAVRVPPGRHVVSFEFMPASFRASLYASLASTIVALAWLGVSYYKQKRRRARQE